MLCQSFEGKDKFVKSEEPQEDGFASEQRKALREAADIIKKAFPWHDARPEARRVALLASFPRSRAGKWQDDFLYGAIWCVIRDCRDPDNLDIEIVKAARAVWNSAPEIDKLQNSDPSSDIGQCLRVFANLGQTYELLKSRKPESIGDFFDHLTQCVKHFESYEANAGDFAVEELQNAFIGLMQRTYKWGKKGLPTKGEVKEMAKARLKKNRKKFDFSKSYWSELLQTASLGEWLPAGRAGRPSKAALDENIKAERNCMAFARQAMRKNYRGNWIAAWGALRAARGGRAEVAWDALRSEEEYFKESQTYSDEEEVE